MKLRATFCSQTQPLDSSAPQQKQYCLLPDEEADWLTPACWQDLSRSGGLRCIVWFGRPNDWLRMVATSGQLNFCDKIEVRFVVQQK
jgi:hypothetical protein